MDYTVKEYFARFIDFVGAALHLPAELVVRIKAEAEKTDTGVPLDSIYQWAKDKTAEEIVEALDAKCAPWEEDDCVE